MLDQYDAELALLWRLYADWGAIDQDRYRTIRGRVERKIRREQEDKHQ